MENQLNFDVVFKAKVIEIIEQKNIVREDGSVSIQQKIRLKGINGDWKDKEVIFDGTEFDVLSGGEYSLGDKVLVNRIIDTNGKEDFYIIGFSRAGYISMTLKTSASRNTSPNSRWKSRVRV